MAGALPAQMPDLSIKENFIHPVDRNVRSCYNRWHTEHLFPFGAGFPQPCTHSERPFTGGIMEDGKRLTPHFYIAIDMKSFYASCEAVARGLDPLTVRLLVADSGRSDQTICLAVSPALKAIGVPSRPWLFEAKRAIADYESGPGQRCPISRQRPRWHCTRKFPP